MNLTLAIRNQENTESKTVLFKRTRVSIGRKEGEILVSDARCSRLHAVMYQAADGALYIRDLGTKNGTWMAGMRLVNQKIEIGQEIRIANLVISVVDYTADSEIIRTWPNLYACLPAQS